MSVRKVLNGIEEVWSWLDNKKTTIGAIMFGASQVLNALGKTEAGSVLETLSQILNFGGQGVMYLGLGDKLRKKVVNKK